MSETSEERVSAALKAAALRAGIVDVDALALADLAKDNGTTEAAAEIVAALQKDKPFLFQRHMRDMTPSEVDQWWREHAKRFPNGAPRPAPIDVSKMAKDMTEAERRKFLDECKRREW